MQALLGLVAIALPGLWPSAGSAQGASSLTITTLSLGRRGSYVTAAVKVHNPTSRIFFVALGGSPPLAIDSAGTRYTVRSVGGVARCDAWDVLPVCIGVPREVQGTLPLQGYTRINPNGDIFLSLEFYGRESRASTGSVSASLIARSARNETEEESLTEDQKRRQLSLVNLGSAPVEITESRDR